jgi:hypothetical protein
MKFLILIPLLMLALMFPHQPVKSPDPVALCHTDAAYTDAGVIYCFKP